MATAQVLTMRPLGRVLDARLRQDALTEVEWYFQLAEAEMSAPSNFGRMLASVSSDGYWRTPEDHAEAATAYRRNASSCTSREKPSRSCSRLETRASATNCFMFISPTRY